MQNIDFSPLFRHSVGYDRLQKMFDSASRLDSGDQSYPPYNIEAYSENAYAITMAAAGFSADDLDVTVKENTLIISGKSADNDKTTQYLHRGIARRAFERRFQLAETIKVTGSSLDNGLLRIDLLREIPEAQKPRKIEISTVSTSSKQIEADKAA